MWPVMQYAAPPHISHHNPHLAGRQFDADIMLPAGRPSSVGKCGECQQDRTGTCHKTIRKTCPSPHPPYASRPMRAACTIATPPTGHAASVHKILLCRDGACTGHAAPLIKRYGIVLQNPHIICQCIQSARNPLAWQHLFTPCRHLTTGAQGIVKTGMATLPGLSEKPDAWREPALRGRTRSLPHPPAPFSR